MNLCIRRDAHRFIGGFPDGELFHMDMEDGAYMMCLYEAYAGAKWLSSPSMLYVRRVDNGLDRRMAQSEADSSGTKTVVPTTTFWATKKLDSKGSLQPCARRYSPCQA